MFYSAPPVKHSDTIAEEKQLSNLCSPSNSVIVFNTASGVMEWRKKARQIAGNSINTAVNLAALHYIKLWYSTLIFFPYNPRCDLLCGLVVGVSGC
jgi:hypothetical protein